MTEESDLESKKTFIQSLNGATLETTVKAEEGQSCASGPVPADFVPHLYDCPNCHKKIKIVFDDDCGCDSVKNIYDFAIHHI